MPEKPDLTAKPPAAARSLQLTFNFENAPLCPECAAPLKWKVWRVIGDIAVCHECGLRQDGSLSIPLQLMRHPWASNHVRELFGILFWTPHTTSGKPITIIDAEQFLGGRDAADTGPPLPYDTAGYEKSPHRLDQSNVSSD